MTIQNTDQYVVESNGTDFSVESQDVDQKVQDDDLFVVCRSGTPYKATYAEVKESMVVPAPPTMLSVSLVEADPEGDRFTSQSFVASSQVIDGEPISTKTIDAHVDGTLSKTVKFDEPLESLSSQAGTAYADALNNDSTNGPWQETDPKSNAFDGSISTYALSGPPTQSSCSWTIPPELQSQGSWEMWQPAPGAIISMGYADINGSYVSVGNLTSDGDGKVSFGNIEATVLYFACNQDSTYTGVNAFAKDSVIITEPDVPALVFATDADMEGLAAGDTVNQTTNFTEPLESSGSTTNPIFSNGVTGTNQQTDLFDGNTATFALSNSNNSTIAWTLDNPLEGDWRFFTAYRDKVNFRVSIIFADGSDEEQNYPPDPLVSGGWIAWTGSTKPVSKISLLATGFAINTFWSAVELNGAILVDGAVQTSLTFANGTNMSALAAGDAVSQAGGPNYKERTNYNDGAITLTEPEIDKFFDGDIDTYMVSLAGAWTAGGGNINIDLSTAPITDVKEVKFSFNKALLDNGAMTPTLIYNSTSQGSIINMPRVDTGTHYVTTFTPGNAPLTQMGFYLLLNSTVNTDWETTSGVQVVKNDGTVEWLTSGGPTGTVGSITGTTASLSSSSGAWTNGVDVTSENTTTGTVSGVSNTTASLSSSSGSWVNGLDVVGPQKTIVEENARLYCAFDSSGNITDLQNNPQDPPYTTQDSNPGLTFTFPATFPSGQTPDEELSDGTTFTVDVSAANDSGTSGPVSATVQPEPGTPASPLAGLTTLYSHTSSGVVTSGIDLVDGNGLVWIKSRSGNLDHVLTDTIRGKQESLFSNTSDAQVKIPQALNEFSTKGFYLGNDDRVNKSDDNYVAWTFNKAEGYFDVVKQTLTTSPATINHSLGTTPGLIIGKNVDTNSDWICSFNGFLDNEYIILNSTATKQSVGISVYYSKSAASFNYNPGAITGAGDYVFYIFAEDTPGMIKCGSYIGNDSTTGPIITTGFTPQWVLIKRAVGGNESGGWPIFDSKRGFSTGLGVSDGKLLSANYVTQEQNDKTIVALANGFQIADNGGTINEGGATMMYVAIAEPPDARSQTPTELAETKLKFATFENRSMVKCGNDAEAARDALIQELALQGYSLPDILELL